MYVAIKLYHESRSKTLINWLYFCAGISISYSRLLDITTDIARKMIKRYYREGEIVVPGNLRKNILTIVAKDNIDHNARSTTATKHCHGTSFSIFQFPTIQNKGHPIEDPIDNEEEDDDYSVADKRNNSSSKKVEKLPASYTLIKHFLSPFKTLNPKQSPIIVSPDLDQEVYKQGVTEEYEWLKKSNNEETSTWIPWAPFHAAKQRSEVRRTDISVMWPIIDEPVHTLDMQYHCMTLISKAISHLNPGQIAVDTADQPIFALTK